MTDILRDFAVAVSPQRVFDHTCASELFEERAIGRARLPASVLGLLFHGAEHTTRHVGQLVTTLKIARGTIRPR